MQGFAIGGYSELNEGEFVSARLASLLAQDFGMFGYKPHELSDLLAGKRVDLKPEESTFWRMLTGTARPADLDAAMQLVHKLFITEVRDSAHSEPWAHHPVDLVHDSNLLRRKGCTHGSRTAIVSEQTGCTV